MITGQNRPATPPPVTNEAALKTLGQRRVNFVWELTQALIAVIVTLAMVYCAVAGKESPVLSNAFTLIIAMYFIRTNHTKSSASNSNDPNP